MKDRRRPPHLIAIWMVLTVLVAVIVGREIFDAPETAPAPTTTLSLLGFGAGGVAASSVAASAQSFFYGASTTGLFSAAQSDGAAGLGWSTTLLLGTTAAGTAAVTGRAKL